MKANLEPLLTGQEVMALLKVKRTKLYELVRSGKLQRVKGMRSLRFTRRAVERFIGEDGGSYAQA